MSDSQDIKKLGDKLSILDAQLKKLLEATQSDLEIARQLQKALVPERLPQIHGLQCFAKHMSSGQMAADFFDIIPFQDKWGTYFIAAWTETFGLSAILLQTLVHIQGQRIVEKNGNPPADDIFFELIPALRKAKKHAKYSMLVMRLDLKSLTLSGLSVGMPPLWLRLPEHTPKQPTGHKKGIFQDLATELNISPESPCFQLPNSGEDLQDDQIFKFKLNVEPGTRILYLSPTWGDSLSIEGRKQALDIEDYQSTKANTEILDDLNYLMLRAEDFMKTQSKQSDISSAGFEVHPKILHLA